MNPSYKKTCRSRLHIVSAEEHYHKYPRSLKETSSTVNQEGFLEEVGLKLGFLGKIRCVHVFLDSNKIIP